MERVINTYNEVVGFHRYPNAPKWCDYLSHRHRHVFVIRCEAKVCHNERQLEFNEIQNQITDTLVAEYGKNQREPCEFGDMSCESIAEWLLNKFDFLTKVQVLEDYYGGATLTK